MKLGFIGAGEMGGAIIKGLTTVGRWPKEDVFASVYGLPSATAARARLGVEVSTDNMAVIRHADVIFIAVKPAVVPEVLAEMKKAGTAGKIVVCMALGFTTQKLEAALGQTAVVRIMPNMPVAFGKGMTLLCAGKYVSREQLLKVQELFNRLGQTVEIAEPFFNVATSISGSGPAFVYTMIAGLARAGVQAGLDEKTAVLLAAQMTAGSAETVLKSGKTPGDLARGVATPGGCTAAGLTSLQADNASEVFVRAVQATTQKADEFSK